MTGRGRLAPPSSVFRRPSIESWKFEHPGHRSSGLTTQRDTLVDGAAQVERFTPRAILPLYSRCSSTLEPVSKRRCRGVGRRLDRCGAQRIPNWRGDQQPGDAYQESTAAIVKGELGVLRGVLLQAHARHSVRRLKAVASTTNSALTLARPRSRKRRAPICSLMMPKTGSFSYLR